MKVLLSWNPTHKVRLQLLLEPRDIWVGVYVARWTKVYITVVPMLPVLVTFEREWWNAD